MCNFRFRASTEEQNQAALQTYGILFSKDGEWTEDDLEATASPFATDAGKVQKRDLLFAPPTEGSEGVLARISELLQIDEGTVIEKTEGLGEDEVEEEEEQDSEEQRQIKVHKLESVSSLLHQCWLVYPDSVADGIRTIADALRDPRWREPIGESGLLTVALMLTGAESIRCNPTPILTHLLRLIGNACADCGPNRATVVKSGAMSSLLGLLQRTDLLNYAAAVVFNICTDYPPAQKQAAEMGLTASFVHVLAGSAQERQAAVVAYAADVLEMAAEQEGEEGRLPDETVEVLLQVATSTAKPVDLDVFISLVSTATKYLRFPRFQVLACDKLGLLHVMGALSQTFTQLKQDGSAATESWSPDEDELKQIMALRKGLLEVLADMSALPEFEQAMTVTNKVWIQLRKLLSSPETELQTCACLMLGNLARSDKVCEEFVQQSKYHEPLMEILSKAKESGVLYAALGFLKNLALPPLNKVALGNSGLVELLPRLWAMDTLPQVQYSAVSLARQLLINNLENVLRILAPLSDDPDSKSRLSVVIQLFSRTDAEPVKMEISRCVATVCRVLCSPFSVDTANSQEDARRSFFAHHRNIHVPLSFMIKQAKWPVIRSEAWFILALMARTPEGGDAVAELMEDADVLSVLRRLITGGEASQRKTGVAPSSDTLLLEMMQAQQQGAGGHSEDISAEQQPSSETNAQDKVETRTDLDNALVMISELLRISGGKMADSKRAALEQLLVQAGRQLIQQQLENSTDVLNKVAI